MHDKKMFLDIFFCETLSSFTQKVLVLRKSTFIFFYKFFAFFAYDQWICIFLQISGVSALSRHFYHFRHLYPFPAIFGKINFFSWPPTTLIPTHILSAPLYLFLKRIYKCREILSLVMIDIINLDNDLIYQYHQ